jgi:hypothetical protein
MLLLNGKKKQRWAAMKKFICRKYNLYTKSEIQKHYLSTRVTVKVGIKQPNLTLMNFLRTTKCIIYFVFIYTYFEKMRFMCFLFKPKITNS